MVDHSSSATAGLHPAVGIALHPERGRATLAGHLGLASAHVQQPGRPPGSLGALSGVVSGRSRFFGEKASLRFLRIPSLREPRLPRSDGALDRPRRHGKSGGPRKSVQGLLNLQNVELKVHVDRTRRFMRVEQGSLKEISVGVWMMVFDCIAAAFSRTPTSNSGSSWPFLEPIGDGFKMVQA